MNDLRISIDDMQAFSAVVQCGSISAAAHQLGRSKQTLSRRLTLLEKQLGTQLLHRTTRHLSLTPAGKTYAEHCHQLCQLAEEANRQTSSRADFANKNICITADRLFGETFLPPLINSYAQRFPEVNMQVNLTADKLDLIETGTDVAFRVGKDVHKGFVATALFPAQVKYCASPLYLKKYGTPLHPDDLIHHHCIQSETNSNRWPFRGKRNKLAMIDISSRLQLDSFTLVRSAVLAGLGIAVFPEFACRPYLENGLLQAVLEDWNAQVGTVNMLHAKPQHMPAYVKAFTNLVSESGWRASQPP